MTSAFDEYNGMYLTYLRSLSQTLIVAVVSSEMLGNFPAKLPAHLREPMARDFRPLAAALMRAADAAEAMRSSGAAEEEGINEPVEVPTSEPTTSREPTPEERLTLATLHLIMSLDSRGGGKSLPELGETFAALANHQALAMTFAHLDAFLGDSLRVICKAKPEVLKRKKEVSWSTVLGFSDLNSAVRHFTETLVYEFGWQTLVNRLRDLENQFGVKLGVDQSDLDLLTKAEQQRHLIIHNAGIVNQRYLEEVGGDLSLGEVIVISIDDVEKVQDAARFIAGDVFRGISTKFLGIEDRDITRVWRREKGAAMRGVNS